jgi:lipoprotein-anchoring transpeptidase ErfK/SrfK
MGIMGDARDQQGVRPGTAVVLSVVSALLAVVLMGTVVPGAARADIWDDLFPTTTTTRPKPTTTTAPKPRPHVPVSTLLATPKGAINTYDRPGGTAIGRVGRWYGYSLTVPVVEQRRDWLRVRLPERPNGKTAWVRRSAVTTSRTPYRIVIRLNETKLILYKDGFPVMVAPVGIGKSSTPTAPGPFFVTVIQRPDPHRYGPFLLSTSGHSEAIQSWEGTGDAITAIHGPVSKRSAQQIGRTGTRLSNGCIRMHLPDLERLGVVPIGTPVDINPS